MRGFRREASALGLMQRVWQSWFGSACGLAHMTGVSGKARPRGDAGCLEGAMLSVPARALPSSALAPSSHHSPAARTERG